MAKHDSGATINGRKPVVSEQVHEHGVRGGSGEAPHKQAHAAGMGAHDPGTGKKEEPNEGGNGPVAGKPETLTRGTSVEEQRKRLAKRLYPSSRGPM